MTDRFIAVDWGTTNRRAYLIDDGAVVDRMADTCGIRSLATGDYVAEVDALRHRLCDAPVLLAGMVGSNRGWVDAGYVPCPATLETLAAAVVRPAAGVAIVPGVKIVDGMRADVMRGEEVQLLGAAASGLVPDAGLLCQPGTHCKWARLDDGAIVDFSTAMTGELFALLRDHALIGAAMTGAVADGPAFRDGVARSADSDLTTALFGVRPASLLQLRDDADAAAYVSGLLIGADCRARAQAGEDVYLLADPALGTLYATALRAIGAVPHAVASDAAFLAGIVRLQEFMS